ncbi:nucleotide kinase [Gordonia phage Ronaldo]|uniref:DUF3310 domain-containing protein n=4 Tax=Ronaldovirus TaxID=2733205 RepID=A0A6B9L8E9_9CAUD|nr:nucleotide kinase [Gordonia phage Fryberger]YP_009807822.1 nucleotide kinase [Gordonia phage Ronaldo]QDH48466.1 hypothetical protein SEA_ZIKO_130 [Gordonia phage Ziko]QHB38242.1 hypothetical protein SEA_VOLT_131 [Gordonia phage Volt]QTF81912.1 hypothetical protein SEA_GUEY18_131 [Gordonia phage Guey18]AXN53539.1 hypothetical protein SEA_FRYBERGER_126 [Gordonia phage Fryberger]AXN53688.1 hypothetical protein SEA_RONALDO_128 [Gordonia phage Ronaldo]
MEYSGATKAFVAQLDSDPVEHPNHYTGLPIPCVHCGHNIECIDVAKHFNFSRGSALKYIWRADLKSNTIEDLRKAKQYLEFEIEKLEKELNGKA